MSKIRQLTNSIAKIFFEVFIFDREKRSLLKAKWAKLNIKKYALKALDEIETYKKLEEKEAKIIWQYWHQGEKNAPEIIKKCLESTKRHYPDYQINVLSFETIKDYIELPQRFYWLLKNKKISTAHFSDILRLNLLSKYGGIWIDATMYSTSKLPQEILDSNFFVYQKNSEIDPMGNCMSCYFIKANANNLWLNMIKKSLENYWSENDFVVNYFLFEHLTTILLNESELLKDLWNEMPCIYTNNICAIQDKKFDKINECDFNKILNATAIHKLTYKTIPEGYNKKDTYLYELLENN
ncbi:MAG: hypothetical protein IJB79_03445 [Candidatus Gastranaerophilales bacterium]|nr:hypothetical protein [Candidatus Gastranaerophilales bacterium]